MMVSLPDWLSQANRQFSSTHPGESGARRPVHVVYGGAHLFQAGLVRKLGDAALRAFHDYAPDEQELFELTEMPKEIAAAVYPKVIEKLEREPVEDYRIDFEDGYGNRVDEEEDGHAEAAALEAAKAMEQGLLPAFFGIRIKPLDEELKDRSFRTLGRFLTVLLEKTGGVVPRNFVVTLPKITVPEQVRALAQILDGVGNAGIELMIETPQALWDLRELVAATGGRCAGVHFGPYDYTASLGITAAQQTLSHPACDFARFTMQAMLGGTSISISDGPTTVMPIAPYKGESLHGARHAENRAAVHRAWKLHYQNVRRALAHGFYQGWDLHPGQLPMRYAAVYSFFLEGLPEASKRLHNFIEKAAQATRVGNVFDDAATGQGLLNYFLRAIRCGAVDEQEVPGLTGLSIEELRTASFGRILQMRRSHVTPEVNSNIKGTS